MQQITLIWEIIIFGGIAAGAVAVSLATAGKQQKKMSRTDIRFKNMLDGKLPVPEKRMQRLKFTYWLQDVGHHAEAARYAYEWGIMDARTKASYEAHLKIKEAEQLLAQSKKM